MKNRNGFTLLEMVIVLAIFSILAVASYPKVNAYMDRNEEKYRSNQEYLINKALMQYYALDGSYCKADCGSGGSITASDAAVLFEKLRKRTGCAIMDSGKYLYRNASGIAGTNVEIKKIIVLPAP